MPHGMLTTPPRLENTPTASIGAALVDGDALVAREGCGPDPSLIEDGNLDDGPLGGTLPSNRIRPSENQQFLKDYRYLNLPNF